MKIRRRLTQMEMQNTLNPFTQRGMIRSPDQFFGRRAELNQIFDRLRKMQSLSVVGERRIGKSSLLYHVYQIAGQRLGEGFRVFYTDLPDVTDEPSFYRRVCQELGAEGSSFSDLERAVRSKKVIACIDEFEKVAEQPEVQSTFSRGFFDSLRSLAQSGNFALLVATQHSLADLCRNEKIATSPFWNIFSRLDLGLFTQKEAVEFIHTQFSSTGVTITEEEVARVLQLAGRYPFFLQLACCHLFEMKVGRVTQWETAFKQEAFDHLLFLWEHRKWREKATLQYVLGLLWLHPNDRLVQDLMRRGLLVRDSQKRFGCWVFSEAFESIVRNQPKLRWRWKWLMKPLEIIERLIKIFKDARGLVGK